MSTRSWENSGVSEGLGGICEGVRWSTEAGWIEEWLAAYKAASHRILLGGGLCLPGALRWPPPRISRGIRQLRLPAWGAVAVSSRIGQAAAGAIVSRHARIPDGLPPSGARVRFGAQPEHGRGPAPTEGGAGAGRQRRPHAPASLAGASRCHSRFWCRKAFSRVTSLGMTATIASLKCFPATRRRSYNFR